MTAHKSTADMQQEMRGLTDYELLMIYKDQVEDKHYCPHPDAKPPRFAFYVLEGEILGRMAAAKAAADLFTHL